MLFKLYLEVSFKKRKKKDMDRLTNPYQDYVIYDKATQTYPQTTQPAGGPVSGVGPVIS